MKPLRNAQVILLILTVGMGLVAVMLLTMMPSVSAIQIVVGILFGLGLLLVVYFLVRNMSDSFAQSKPSSSGLPHQATHAEDSASPTSLTKANSDVTESSAEPSANGFCLVGEFWKITFRGGKEIFLKNIKGLTYIAVLLSNPNKPMASIELVAAGEGNVPDSDLNAAELDESDLEINDGFDGVPILDEKAKSEYRDQLRIILEEQATLDKQNERYKQLERDKQMIMQELRVNTRLGGQSRNFTDHADKARVKVQKQISEAIKKIEQADPILGEHLRQSIKTGHQVVYQPESLTNWKVKLRL